MSGLLRAPATARRLSEPRAFWAICLAFAAVTAFSTTPSGLYGIYERRQGFSLTTITFVYAVYAVGTVASLVLAGHVSDWYGRRTVLIPAIALAAVASVILIASASLPAVIAARILTGLALGATVATASAYLADIDIGLAGRPTTRAGAATTAANIGGLATGPLIAGVLARYVGDPLSLPYVVTFAALVLGVLAVLASPETRAPVRPRPRYRPQRLALPAEGRGPFVAASSGVFLCFAAYGLFAGLAGAVLTGLLHHPSPALAGATIFITYGSGAATQIATAGWPAQRLLPAGIAGTVAGLALTTASAWLSPPSLAAFLIGGVLVGAGGGAIFRSSIATILAAATAEDRASSLATFFAAGFCGLSVPVIGLGIALQHLSTRVTLLAFTLVVSAGILAAAPVLLRSRQTAGGPGG